MNAPETVEWDPGWMKFKKVTKYAARKNAENHGITILEGYGQHTRGMFRPFNTFVSRALSPNANSRWKINCPIEEKNLNIFFFMWTLETWNEFEVAWEFSSRFRSFPIVSIQFSIRITLSSINMVVVPQTHVKLGFWTCQRPNNLSSHFDHLQKLFKTKRKSWNMFRLPKKRILVLNALIGCCPVARRS